MSEPIRLTDFEDIYKKKKHLPEDKVKEEADIIRNDLQNIQNLMKENCKDILILDGATKQRAEADKEKGSVQIVKELYGSYWTQQYVGVIECDCTTENGTNEKPNKRKTYYIGSRFETGENQFFLNYVIAKSLNVNVHIFKYMNAEIGTGSNWDLLEAVMFLKNLSDAAKKNVYRTYRYFHSNEPKVKGKIDIAEQIKRNTPFNGNIACTYREYSIDTPVNRLIFTTIKYLERKYPGLVREYIKENDHIRTLINQFTGEIIPVSREELPKLLHATKKRITNHVYRDWEEVRSMAQRIMRKRGNLLSGANRNVNGILFDMNKIWEHYLESILCSTGCEYHKRKDILFEIKTIDKKESKTDDTAKRYAEYDLYWPDKLKSDEKCKLVLDAKYKDSWSDLCSEGQNDNKKSSSWEKVREDVFQVISYMHIEGINKSGVIAPYQAEDGNKDKDKIICRKFELTKDKDDYFFLLGLDIPKANEFNEFCDAMKENEAALQKKVKELLQ